MGKILVVNAKCGELNFQENANPYNPAAYQEQYDSCIEKIHQKMKESGRYEMKDAFVYSAEIIEKPEA
ncbi:hypothetical protein GAY88_01765 [Phocaeicola vulgatus]|jgi:hypothetical protein|uniref:Uncharacterized protein n=2 Tax=Phocaeicola TaxID=909656 RepID=A0A6I0ZZP4_PHOVU|nr:MULTISPECIES: hypothetical protein [Phocaeicola]KAA5310408.1 hypothetical protein F2Z07_24360 [Phocaeicola dorei]KAB6445344.1 hypothetical protein GAZ08_19495 [Phocaeicola vulgatus]KAB6466009.1 hypothetical protein GAZ05_03095 [Phocaeicola vulgatus]KAB6467332.1 hypothetical protein GAY99_04810 [Phocaeicola vulgatus]KAB6471372.1 hypothetical protein GAZ07_09965 [Phocaeicola vulgatus]